MKNIFNFNRFLNLVSVFFIESGYRVLLYLLVTFLGLTTILYFIHSVVDSTSYVSARYFFLFLFLVINQSIVLSVTGQDFRSKKKLSQYLLIPNSIFEKLLVYALVLHFFFIVVSLVLFKLGDYLILSEIIPQFNSIESRTVHKISPIIYNADTLQIGFFVFTFFNLLSFTFFISNTFLKTILGILSVLLLIVISALWNHFFFWDVDLKNTFSLPFGPLFVKNPLETGQDYVLKSNLSDMFFNVVVLLPLSILGMSIYYFKLKEREV